MKIKIGDWIKVESGMGYREGIIKDMNLRENMTLPSMGLFESLLIINKTKEKKLTKINNIKYDNFEMKSYLLTNEITRMLLVGFNFG